MPPFYDIYGFSRNRTKENVDNFIEYYSHRERVENCEGSELLIRPYKEIVTSEILVPVKSLSEVIQYGIKNKNHGFAFYLDSKGLRKDIKSLILKFTYDSGVIFGISIEEGNNQPRASELESELSKSFSVTKTSIQVEHAPSDDEEEFDKGMENG